MKEYVWSELSGKEVRYSDQTWEMTGDVSVREDGELLGVEVVARDDVRHEDATLFFALDDSSASLNPGQLGGHFDRIERTEHNLYLVLAISDRTYRYRATRIEP